METAIGFRNHREVAGREPRWRQVYRSHAGYDGRKPDLGPQRVELDHECQRWSQPFQRRPPSEINDTANKIQHATDYENEMIQEYIPGPPPPKAAPAFGLGAREYGTATLRRVRQGSDDAVLRARVLVGALLLHPINQLLGLCGRDVVMVSEFVGEPLWSELCGQCQVTNNTAIAGRMESDYENGGLFNDTDVFPLDTALSRLQRKGVLQPSERRCLARR